VFFDQYEGQVAPLSYHMYWPSSADSFYLFNPTDIVERRSYYDPAILNYVPAFRYDGKKSQDLFGTAPAYPEFFVWLRGAVDSLRAISSPLRINMSQYVSNDLDTVYVSFDIVAVDTIIYDVDPDVYMAASEVAHTYPAPTGHHKYAFRKMYPDSNGEMTSIQKGDSLHFDWSYYVVPGQFHVDKLITTIWVQNDTDAAIPGKQRNKVLQAAQARVVDLASVVRGDDGADVMIGLGQSAPNPFTSETTIAYMVQGGGKAHLAVYTATGRLVTSLVDGYVEPGTHAATWNGRDRFGKEVGSGVYYYRLETEDGSRGGRMVYLK